MAKTRKFREIKKNKKNKKHTGGMLENNGLPVCNILSQFRITDEAILQFNRTFDAPMDCFINALQIMNVLDTKAANIMRISTLGMIGFNKEQIEIIFIYSYGTNFDFKNTNNYNEWVNMIKQLLKPGNVVFAGYTGHVFLIGRFLNGEIIYIDPSIPVLCSLSNYACEQHLPINKPGFEWFLLFNSQEKLSVQQQKLVIEYTKSLQKNKNN